MARKQFLRSGAVLAGGIVGFGLLGASRAAAEESEHGGRTGAGSPKPIPGGFGADFSLLPVDPFIHVLPPAVGFEMSTITDFRGVIAAAEVQGTARATDGSHFWFDADMRFMRGQYIDDRGRRREHAFGFV